MAANDQSDLAVVVKYARHWHEYRESHCEYEHNRAAGFRSQDWLPRGCDFPSDDEQDESGVIWLPRPSKDDNRPPEREPITRVVEKAVQVTLADTRNPATSQPSNQPPDIPASTAVRDAHTMTTTHESMRDKQHVFVVPASKETVVPEAPKQQRELSQRLLTLRKSRGLNAAAAWDIPLGKTPKPKPARFLRAAPKAATNVHAAAAAALETALCEASDKPTRAAEVKLAASQLRDKTTDDDEDKSTVADWDETSLNGKSRSAKKRADRHAVRLATILGRCAHAQGADDAALESLVDTALHSAGPLAKKDPSFRAAADAVRFATTLARHAYAGGARDTDVREMVERVLESDDACSQHRAVFRAAADALRGAKTDAVTVLGEGNAPPGASLGEAKESALRFTSDPQARLAFVNSAKDATVQRLVGGGLANNGETDDNKESTKRTSPSFRSADHAVRLATELGRRAHAIGATDAQVDRLVDSALSDFEDTNKQDTVLSDNPNISNSYSLFRVSYDAVRLATKFARRAFASGAKEDHVLESVNNLLLSQDDKGPSHLLFRGTVDAVRFVTSMGRRAYAIDANDTGVERMVEDALREQIDEFGEASWRGAAFSSSIKSADCEIEVDRSLGQDRAHAGKLHLSLRDSAAALRGATKLAYSAYARGAQDADVQQLVENELQSADNTRQSIVSTIENLHPATVADRREAQGSWTKRSNEVALGNVGANESQEHVVESGGNAGDTQQHAPDARGTSFDSNKHDSHSLRAAIGMIRSATKLARRAYVSGAEDAHVKDLVESVLRTDGSADTMLQIPFGKTVDAVHLVMSMGHRASATSASDDDVEKLVDAVLRELGTEQCVPSSHSVFSSSAHAPDFEQGVDRALGRSSNERHLIPPSGDNTEAVRFAAKLAPSGASGGKDVGVEQVVDNAFWEAGSTKQPFKRADATDFAMTLGQRGSENNWKDAEGEQIIEDVHGESDSNVREQQPANRDKSGANDIVEQNRQHDAGDVSRCLSRNRAATPIWGEGDERDARGTVASIKDQSRHGQHRGGSEPDSTEDAISMIPTSNVSADNVSLEASGSSVHVSTPRRARSESPIKRRRSLDGGARRPTGRSKSPVRNISKPSNRRSASSASTKSNTSSARSSNRSSTGDLRSAARSARLAARLAERGVDDETARAARSAARIVAAAGIKESDRASSASSWTLPASGRSSPESVMRRVAAAADMPVKQEIRASLEEIASMVQDLEHVATRKSTPPRRSAASPPTRDLARRPRSRTPSPLRTVPRERTPSPRRSWADDEFLVPVTVSTLADDEYKPRLRTVAERTEINDVYSVRHPPRDGDQPLPALVAMGAPRQRRSRRHEPRLLPSAKEDEIPTDASVKLLGGDDDSTIPTRPEVVGTQHDDASVLSPPPPPPACATKLSDRESPQSDSKRDGRFVSDNRLPVFLAADASATERQLSNSDAHLYSALRQYDIKRAAQDDDISAGRRDADEWSDV